jgi:hypothetical protein
MGKSTISMAIFNSYVSLPDGSGHEATKHLDFFPFTSGSNNTSNTWSWVIPWNCRPQI